MYKSVASAASQQPKRRRPALACQECRRRKVKCNRSNPCDQCTKMGMKDSCIFPSVHGPVTRRPAIGVQKPALPAVPFPQKTGAILSYLGQGRPSESYGIHQTRPENHLQDSITRQPEREASQASQPPQLTPQSMGPDMEPLPLVAGHEGTGDEVPTDLSGRFFIRGREVRTRLYGQSNWISSFLQLGDITSFTSMHGPRKGLENNQGERYAILDKYKDSIKGRHPEGLNGEWNVSDLLLKMPTREFADILVKLYLETFGLVYRLFHIPSFWNEYETFWKSPEQASVGTAIKLLLVMAVGTCFFVEDPALSTPSSPADMQSLAHDWIRISQAWLSTPFDKSRLDLTALQVHCLLLIARQTSLAGGDLIWISSGALVRTATLMGLHRESGSLPMVSTFCAEIRRRLWYTILEIDLQCTLDTGLPFLMSQEDYDTAPPENINDEDISLATTVIPPGKPSNIQTQSSFQCALIQSLPIRMSIVAMVNKVKFDPSYEKILSLHHEFMKSFSGTPMFLRFNETVEDSSSPSNFGSQSFQQVLFDLHVRRFLLTLHRPFAAKAKGDPRFYFSRKVCIDSCLTLLSHRRRCAEAIPDGKRLEMLLSGAGGMFRDEYFHATLGVCLEMIAETSELGLIGSSYLSRSHRRDMNEALQDFLTLCDRRILCYENGSKLYLLLRLAMAGCKSREDGKLSRSEMAQELLAAAESAAMHCYDKLRERRGLPPFEDFLHSQANKDSAMQPNPSNDLIPTTGDLFEYDESMLASGMNVDSLDFSTLFSWNFDDLNPF